MTAETPGSSGRVQPRSTEDNMADEGSKIGWWTISGEDILAMLRRCAEGEDPDLVYAEMYANANVDRP